jgi:hypothetical protein
MAAPILRTRAPLSGVDPTYYLDSTGAIAPQRGPARKLTDRLAAVVAHASDFDRADAAPGPICFGCRKRDRRVVETGITGDGHVVWFYPACGTGNRISKRQRTLWDPSHGSPSN